MTAWLAWMAALTVNGVRWLLQEFCCASRLMIVTEPVEAADPCGRCAVTVEEELYFSELRKVVQNSMLQCQPLWLMDSSQDIVAPARAQQIIAHYRRLAGRVKCRESEDKLRALVPMISNISLENHDELLRLIDAITANAPEARLDPVAQATLKAQNRYSFLDLTKARRRRQSLEMTDTAAEIAPQQLQTAERLPPLSQAPTPDFVLRMHGLAGKLGTDSSSRGASSSGIAHGMGAMPHAGSLGTIPAGDQLLWSSRGAISTPMASLTKIPDVESQQREAP